MVMPIQTLRECVIGKAPIIRSSDRYPMEKGQIQPASIDFRLGEVATAVRTAALPHGSFVVDLIERQRKYDFELQREKPNLLERGRTYLIDLMEQCALPDDVYIEFSPKSSTGRCDVFTRVVCDRFSHYDLTPPGYHGRLYAEVTPLSFDIEIKQGLSLVQGRLKNRKNHRLDNDEIKKLHINEAILFGPDNKPLEQKSLVVRDNELYYHVDLKSDVVGFLAKSTVLGPLRLTASKRDQNLHRPEDFWEPIRAPRGGELVLVPGNFYLLQTLEQTRIPPNVCGQIASFKITTGEIRPHYAGFFDPGFGRGWGTRGVLEVRAHDVPFNIVHGQPICSMHFELMDEVPTELYQGNYTESGASLSKHFEDRHEAWTREYWRSRW